MDGRLTERSISLHVLHRIRRIHPLIKVRTLVRPRQSRLVKQRLLRSIWLLLPRRHETGLPNMRHPPNGDLLMILRLAQGLLRVFACVNSIKALGHVPCIAG